MMPKARPLQALPQLGYSRLHEAVEMMVMMLDKDECEA